MITKYDYYAYVIHDDKSDTIVQPIWVRSHADAERYFADYVCHLAYGKPDEYRLVFVGALSRHAFVSKSQISGTVIADNNISDLDGLQIYDDYIDYFVSKERKYNGLE